MSPPDLILFSNFAGDWKRYETGLYDVFNNDILQYDLKFRGAAVTARRTPEHESKWAGFWHLISEGKVEDDRTPDLRRCERLSWVKWIIENETTNNSIQVWSNRRGNNQNMLLWFREEYLVVLSRRSSNYLLKTAYCTEQNHRIRKLRKERDSANNSPKNG